MLRYFSGEKEYIYRKMFLDTEIFHAIYKLHKRRNIILIQRCADLNALNLLVMDFWILKRSRIPVSAVTKPSYLISSNAAMVSKPL